MKKNTATNLVHEENKTLQGHCVLESISYNHLQEEIATQIRRLRYTNRLTQNQVKRETGIHIARIESRQVSCGMKTLVMLCRYFNMSLSDFFSTIENKIKKQHARK